MPAEWEPHAATWISWPHNADDWPGRFEPIPWVFGEIVRKLSNVERVCILVHNPDIEQSARRILTLCGANLSAVEFHLQPTDRIWAREIAAVKWRFNGWAKYENHLLDEAAGHAIATLQGREVWTPDCVLEGGSIDVNGLGTLLTTEECLLSPIQARNPDLTRPQIQATLRDYLGVDQVFWLKNGIAGDDTHGHIDDLARFTDADSVVIVSEPDPSDANYELLRENLDILKRYPLRVRTLPMPAPLIFDGQRLPASYANFYIANGTVLVPVFNDANDRIALNTLAECFPTRQIIGINSVELVWGLGTLHCLTQQQPS
jgi:agmatine deiminase